MKTTKRVLIGILLLYSICLTIIIIASAITSGLQSGNYLITLLSIPIAIYFLFYVLRIKRGRKLLFYYSLLISSLMTISGFKQASSIIELSSALLFLPMTFFFWIQVWPKKEKKHKKIHVLEGENPFNFTIHENNKPINLKKVENPYPEDVFGKNFDIDRRMFLKLIGSAGISVFMLALFTKKAQGAFFGSVPGPGTLALKDTTGAKIDPAIKTPTDGYNINQLDDSSPAYYGFTDKTGAWYIMKEDSSGNFRYVKGSSNFSTNWTNRSSLTYDYFDVIF